MSNQPYLYRAYLLEDMTIIFQNCISNTWCTLKNSTLLNLVKIAVLKRFWHNDFTVYQKLLSHENDNQVLILWNWGDKYVWYVKMSLWKKEIYGVQALR